MAIVERTLADANPARFVESLALLFVAWWRVKKSMTTHVDKIELALQNLANSVSQSFAAGEARFDNIEKRLEVLEITKPTGGEANG